MPLNETYYDADTLGLWQELTMNHQPIEVGNKILRANELRFNLNQLGFFAAYINNRLGLKNDNKIDETDLLKILLHRSDSATQEQAKLLRYAFNHCSHNVNYIFEDGRLNTKSIREGASDMPPPKLTLDAPVILGAFVLLAGLSAMGITYTQTQGLDISEQSRSIVALGTGIATAIGLCGLGRLTYKNPIRKHMQKIDIQESTKLSFQKLDDIIDNHLEITQNNGQRQVRFRPEKGVAQPA